MILEVAILPVRPGQEDVFLASFEQARPIIRQSPGCLEVQLQRCLEKPSQFLLLVRWESLEHHTQGFRGSPAYQEWSRLLHSHYDPFPTVEHYRLIAQS